MKEKIHLKTIIKKILWTIEALLSGFIISILINGIFVLINPSWQFSWIGFILGGLVGISSAIILSIIYKKIIYTKIGEKIGKIILIIFSLLIVWSLTIHFVIQTFYIKDEGLEPYLTKGNLYWVEKFNRSIKKGDIIISQGIMNNRIVSLAIGLPGDKIELKDGIFFINGEPLKNVSYNFYHVYGIDSNTGNYFIVVPPDSFFGIPTLLDEKFADNEQTRQEHPTISNSICPPNSYLNPKDNLCYCNEGFIWNKKEGKDKKCVKGVDLSIWLYKQSDIIGKIIHFFHIGK